MSKQDITQDADGYTTFVVHTTASTAEQAYRAIGDPQYAPGNAAYIEVPAISDVYLVDDAWRLHNALNHYLMFRGDQDMMRIPISWEMPYFAHAQELWYELVEALGAETAEVLAEAFGSHGVSLIVPVWTDPADSDKTEWIIMGHQAL